jgi:glycosyltransferase involved in cell wall biosynthesis
MTGQDREQANVRSAPRSLHVLNVHSGNIYGGVEVQLAANARLGPSRGIEPDFALCFDARCAAEIRASGRPLQLLGEVRIRYPWQALRARRKLRAVLEATRYDAVVVHNAWGLAIFGGVIRSSNVPMVFQLHGACDGEHPSLADRLSMRWPPDLVICNSAYTASTLDAFFPKVRRTIVLHPFEARQAAPGARTSTRGALGAPDDEVVILQASRLDGWKGHRLHLEALARIRTERPWRAWIAGGPQHAGESSGLDDLIAYAGELGIADRVRFLGQRQDVPELMAAADVFCQPNTGPEPFGLVFIEALSAGLPVVTTAMGGALEIVDPTCGFLVPPDPAAVAVALTTLIEDAPRRSQMGDPAKRRARDLCDPDRQTRLTYDAIASVARPELPR